MFAFIDLLRGVAALLVFWFHLDLHILCGYPAEPVPPGSWTYWLVYGFLDLGRYGVALFFMISGFLIPSTLRAPNASLRSYAIHRFCRLYPAYWVAIAAWATAAWLSGDWQGLNARTAVANLTMAQKFLGVPDVIGAFWTLPIELLFYLTCALLFWMGRLAWSGLRLTGAALALCIGLAALGQATGLSLPLAPLFAFTLMFLGDAARQAIDRGRGGMKVLLATACVAGLLVWANLLGYEADEAWRFIRAYWLAMVTFFACLGLRGPIASSRAAATAGRFLADTSYSVYLLHAPVGMTSARMILEATGNPALAAGSGLALTLGAAVVVFRLVEAPAIRFGKRVSGRSAPGLAREGQ